MASRSRGDLAPCQPSQNDSRLLHSSTPADATSASTSPVPCALRQLRLPRRPTCPPLRNSSKRLRAIQSRPDPVRWSARRVAPSGEAGIGPQAVGAPARPARAPGRSGFLFAGRPAPADGPRRPPPPATWASRLTAALPASLSPCRRWTLRPLVVSRRLPA